MHVLLLPLRARFIAYTLVLLITVTLLFEFLFWWSSFYLAIPFALFAALSAIGTIASKLPSICLSQTRLWIAKRGIGFDGVWHADCLVFEVVSRNAALMRCSVFDTSEFVTVLCHSSLGCETSCEVISAKS
jgi:hypothetical protein